MYVWYVCGMYNCFVWVIHVCDEAEDGLIAVEKYKQQLESSNGMYACC
jgi:hypothetical protein